MNDPGRSALGDFLRSRRERLSPAAVGLAQRRRRRTPGLRREEVAERAGIGVDWYIRLEQGRATCPSASTVDALAQALRLDRAEHAHLRALARRTDRHAFVRETVPDSLQRLIAGLPHPAYITGRRWDVLAWNDAAADLLGFDRLAEADRNILVCMFLLPGCRRLFGAAWEQEAKRMVALFRATHDLWAADPAFIALIERLRAGSAEFAAWWAAHDIRGGATGQKLLQHPTRGALRYDYATFQANEDPALKLALYTPSE